MKSKEQWEDRPWVPRPGRWRGRSRARGLERRVPVLWLLLPLIPGPIAAQEAREQPPPMQPSAPTTVDSAWAGHGDDSRPGLQPSGSTMLTYALGGAMGGVVGMTVGALVGGGLQGCGDVLHFDDRCQEEGIYLGALLGSTTGSILGVKLVGRISGAPASTGGTILGAVVGAAGGYLVGLGVVAATGDHEVPFAFGFSLGQGTVTGAVAGLFGPGG